MSEREDNGLAAFFVAGVEPADVSKFFPLFAAKPLIGALQVDAFNASYLVSQCAIVCTMQSS